MSQKALADRLGVSFQQIQKYEKGVNRVGAGRIPQIAEIFGITIGTLFSVNADTSDGAAPNKLISDRAALRMLAAFASVTNPATRYCLIDLVENIGKAERKQGEKT